MLHSGSWKYSFCTTSLWVLICVRVSYAFLNDEVGGVQILFPKGYTSKIDMSLADFGKPRYGGSLIGQVVYPTSESGYPTQVDCGKNNVPCQYACTNFSELKPPYSVPKERGKLSIMLVDRGPKGEDLPVPCYFLSKVFNAQQAGADAVLIVNDVSGSVSTAIKPDDEKLLSLVGELSISAAMISMEDGAKLKDLLRKGTVVLKLDWSSILPKKMQVSWEYWTNTNDECGTNCDEQTTFVKSIKETAKQLSQSGLTNFSPHYLMWTCPEEYAATLECTSQCIMKGKYCVPDPDANFTVGYSGRDVLMMNIHQLCFFQLANSSGKPWLWWDYVYAFNQQCKMKTLNFTRDCAQQVFNGVGGPQLFQGQGMTKWDSCVGISQDNSTQSLPILEQELVAQEGDENQDTVSMLPTIRINGHQYRGQLEAGAVVRAICSAFPEGFEPDVCNQEWVSEDECKEGGDGWKLCHSEENAARWATKCVNTFSGYTCQCNDGWVKAVNSDTGQEMCADVNECMSTNIVTTQPDCSCSRCACINSVGSYKCTGELKNYCTQTNSYGGCWNSVINGTTFHACVDTFNAYKSAAAQGFINASSTASTWYKCQCPPCFGPGSNGGCEPLCDNKFCVASKCMTPAPADPVPVPASKKSGVSTGSIIAISLLSIFGSASLMFGVYQFVLKQRMHAEVRDIMSQYMPLDNLEAPAPGSAPPAASLPARPPRPTFAAPEPFPE